MGALRVKAPILYVRRAEISFNSRHTHLSCFHNEIEAAKAYDKKAAELLGEFAYLNFAKGSD